VATPTNGSVQLGFSILRQFATSRGQDCTLTEVARAMDLPVPTIHRFLKTLAGVGALAALPGGRYTLGPQLADLGGLVRYETLLEQSSNLIVERLAHRLGVTAHLAVLEGGMTKIVAKKIGNPSFRVSTRVGARYEPYCTASGKMLLAALSDLELDDYLHAGALVPLTERTVTTSEALVEIIADVQLRGVAADDEEFQSGVACLAVAVRNSVGRPIAALSASFVAGREDLGTIEAALVETSSSITQRLVVHTNAALGPRELAKAS
jgi:IclR family acetate operon transcriptional repressor